MVKNLKKAVAVFVCMMMVFSFVVVSADSLAIGNITYTENGDLLNVTVPYEMSGSISQLTLLASTEEEVTKENISDVAVGIDQFADNGSQVTFVMNKPADTQTIYVKMGGSSLTSAVKSSFTYTAPTETPTTYAVTFKVDGEEDQVINVEENTAIGSLMPSNPSKSGYTFDGWYDGETKVTSATVVTGPITAIAKFTENTPTEPVTEIVIDKIDYSLNAETNLLEVTINYRAPESASQLTLLATTTEEVTVENIPTVTKAIDQFANAKTGTVSFVMDEPEDNTVTYVRMGGTLLTTATKGSFTYTKSAVTDIVVTFTGYGDGNDKVVTAVDGKVTAPADKPTTSDDTKEFKGWALTADATETDIIDLSTYTFAENKTLYPVFGNKAVAETYTVEFKVGGVVDSALTQIVAENGKATKPATDPSGETAFLFWSLEGQDPAVEYNFDSPVTGNIVLVAIFADPASEYTITFKGYDEDKTVETVGGKVTAPADKPTTSDNTKEFKGWALTPNAAESAVLDLSTYIFTESTTLYPVYGDKSTPSKIKGDVAGLGSNKAGDGKVTTLDASRILQYLLKKCNLDGSTPYDASRALTSDELYAADVAGLGANKAGDGKVTTLDASRILQYLLKKCNLDGSTPYDPSL